MAGRQTVSAYLDWWLTSIDGMIDVDSLRRHHDGVKRMKPMIGRHMLTDFRPEHVVTMLGSLRTTTVKRGTKGDPRTLSRRTVRYCYVTLRKAHDSAQRNGAVPHNVARVIEATTVPKVEVVAHKPEDIGRLADVFDASTDRLAPLYRAAPRHTCSIGCDAVPSERHSCGLVLGLANGPVSVCLPVSTICLAHGRRRCGHRREQ
jgi:hypothetical protein